MDEKMGLNPGSRAKMLNRRQEMEFPTSMIVNILVKKEGELYIAHCLELDIVSASPDEKTASAEIIDLIKAQIDYAFSNNNLEYLYHPAPALVWQEFYACKAQIENKINIESAFRNTPERFVPPWIVARTCTSSGHVCYA